MLCKCPACDQLLILQSPPESHEYLCCDRCDRGFRPEDSRCPECGKANPFARRDSVSYACLHCGATQPDLAARMTA